MSQGFWRWLRGEPAPSPAPSPAPPVQPQVSKGDRYRDEINQLVAEFLAEGHAPVLELKELESCEMGYGEYMITGWMFISGYGWMYHERGFCSFALNTDGKWYYAGYYGVRDHNHVNKVEKWEGDPNRWLEIDEREFRHYTDTGTASPQHALEAARRALAEWRRER